MLHLPHLWRVVSLIGALALGACGGGDQAVAVDAAPTLAAVRSAGAAAAPADPNTVVVRASGTSAAGVAPRLQLIVDGVAASPLGGVDVLGETPADYGFVLSAAPQPGSRVDVVFVNDGVAINGDLTEDRNLVVDAVTLGDGRVLLPTDAGVVYDRGDGAAAFDGINTVEGQRGMWWSGALRMRLPLAPAPSAGTVVVRARADLAAAVGAEMHVRVNGLRLSPSAVLVSNVGASASYTFNSTQAIPAGAKVDVVFSNDAVVQVDGQAQDRNLYVDWISVDGGPALGSSQASVVLDRGYGDAAFDGLDTLPSGPGLYWDGALRFTKPAVDEGPPDPARTVIVSARADLAGGVGALMEVRVDGVALTPEAVMVDNTSAFQDYRFRSPAVLSADAAIDVIFHNDAVIDGEDRNLYVRSVTVGTVATLDPATAEYDTGVGASALDGLVVFSGREALVWAGALRFGNRAPASAALEVHVRSGAVYVPGARVSAGAVSAVTDASGRASLPAVPAEAELVVTVERDGYVTQALRISPSVREPNVVALELVAVKSQLSVGDIAQPQLLAADDLNATVRLPGNAMVRADGGQPAVGAATLKLTPWDVIGADLQAMPGGARGVDQAGAPVQLISYGMLSIDFTDASGARLQLAPGKTAVLEMDLPGKAAYALPLGTSIPMWFFDASRGLWVEEGVGTVVAPASGAGARRLRAEVAHFSTWNWDLKLPGDLGVSSFVRCTDVSGASIACSLRAEIELPDARLAVRSLDVPAAGVQILNLPSAATIHWSAVGVGGIAARLTTGVQSDLVIPLSAPTRSPFVSCRLPNGSAIACSVTATYKLTPTGDVSPFSADIPATGAQLTSGLGPVLSVDWEATAYTVLPLLGSTSQWTYYEARVTGAAADAATVTLDLQVVAAAQGAPHRVRCSSSAPRATPPTTTSCDLSLLIYSNYRLVGTLYMPGAPSDTIVEFVLPSRLQAIQDNLRVRGSMVDSLGVTHNAYEMPGPGYAALVFAP